MDESTAWSWPLEGIGGCLAYTHTHARTVPKYLTWIVDCWVKLGWRGDCCFCQVNTCCCIKWSLKWSSHPSHNLSVYVESTQHISETVCHSNSVERTEYLHSLDLLLAVFAFPFMVFISSVLYLLSSICLARVVQDAYANYPILFLSHELDHKGVQWEK